jgi:hypothetical protein
MTCPRSFVQFTSIDYKRFSNEMLFKTCCTILFALSMDPWSRGVLGCPVTMKQLGLLALRRSTTIVAMKSFPLSELNKHTMKKIILSAWTNTSTY